MTSQPFRQNVIDRVADRELANVENPKFYSKGIASGLAAADLSNVATAGFAFDDLSNVSAQSFATDFKFTIPPYGTAARSLNDRFGEPVYVADYLTAVWSGGNDSVPAIHAARDEVQRRGRGRMIMPPGVGACNSSIDLRPLHGTPFILEGYGAGNGTVGGGITQLNVKHASGSAILHGDVTKFAMGRTPFARFKDFTIANAVGAITLGAAAFDLMSCDNTRLQNIHVTGVRRFLNIGDPTNQDDCFKLWIEGCVTSGSADSNSADCHMMLGSAAALVFDGRNFFNGSGHHPLFQQPAASLRNIDGLTMGTDKAGQWTRFLDIGGKGIVNGKFVGTWHDRAADYGIYFAPASGGACRHVWFIGCEFENAPLTCTTNVAQAVYFAGTGATAGKNINFLGCHFIGFGGQSTLDLGEAIGTNVRDCTFVDCAPVNHTTLMPQLIKVASGGRAVIQNNTAMGETNQVATVPQVPYRAIAWGGPTDSTRRGQSGNFWGPATNADSGTI